MTDLQMLGNSFCEIGLVSTSNDLVPIFDPKVHLFENSLLKILAQLHGGPGISALVPILLLSGWSTKTTFILCVIPNYSYRNIRLINLTVKKDLNNRFLLLIIKKNLFLSHVS